MKRLNKGSQLAEDQHPVDALGVTLGRIDTLLSALGTMFEPGSEGFAVDQAFLMHTLVAAQGLVISARGSLQQINEQCDLTMHTSGRQQVYDDGPSTFAHGHEVAVDHGGLAEPEPIPYAPFSSTSRFVEELTSGAANSPFASGSFSPPDDEAERSDAREGFAQNYLDLLRKLTAAEVFAAEQQALSAPGTPHQLLPLLRSLREDFQKLHSAA